MVKRLNKLVDMTNTKHIPDIINDYELDTEFDDVPRELFDGKTLNHHIYGHLPLKVVDGRLFAEVELTCNRPKCTTFQRYKTYLGSGLHAGAWCYAFNIESLKLEACLRDQSWVCDECEAK